MLLHSPKGDGIAGIGGQAQLFTSAKSAEKTLNQVTWTLSIIFIGLTIILSAGWLAN
ncbi:Preprotein translocase subunit SecG [Synechocystis sp. PCC 6714]|nr:Preprotein translocase subunit SecG [Synechocystis sp. PCC 6714]